MSPTTNLIRGQLGRPLLVLSLRDVRIAELLDSTIELPTADGVVVGRPGDWVITTPPAGERYPIRRSIFLGAYQILGRVQNHAIAERIMHIRRAWPVVSNDAEFDYGAGRGRVTVARGGWLYQSDDNDFGLINASINHESHTEVGVESEISLKDWERRYRLAVNSLTFLPPLLTLLALLAYALAESGQRSDPILALETFLLVGGALLVWCLRADKWTLKASVKSGLCLARRFQATVQLLGHVPSRDFPNMALWRAGQDLTDAQTDCYQDHSSKDALLVAVKEEIAALIERMKRSKARFQHQESLATIATIAAIVGVIACNTFLVLVKRRISVELFAIWLPSLIGAIHSFHFRKRTTQHIDTVNEFLMQLHFIKVRIYAPVPADSKSAGQIFRANLRLLCKIVAQYNQREIQYSISDLPQVPI
jgi:hypothetical protein